MRDKKGFSQVITIVLMIVFSLVAIAIIWGVVSTLIQENVEEIELNLNKVNLKVDNVLVENATTVSVRIKREVGKGNLSDIKIVLSDGENSEDCVVETTLQELGLQTFECSVSELDLSKLATVTVAPMFVTSSGKELSVDATDTKIVREGEVPSCFIDCSCAANTCISQTCDDGCGGTCAGLVLPDCGGKECGDNGCGGSCGTCESGYSCNEGMCGFICPEGQTDNGDGTCTVVLLYDSILKDTFIRLDSPTDRSTEYFIYMGGQYNGYIDYEGLFKWNVSAVSGTILSAIYENRVESLDSGPFDLHVQSVTSDSSWATAPSLGNLVVGSSNSYSTADVGTWKTHDITSLVQGWVDGSVPNYGMAITYYGSGNGRFYTRSSEYSDNSLKPKLTITYYA